jgi:UDP-N-acetylmuramoyl-tripeptide--D-alanyl-D-alanine ligase
MRIDDLNTLTKILSPLKILNPEKFKKSSGFSIDSRSIKKNEIFVAVKGTLVNGHDFIEAAVKNGAGLVIAERCPCNTDIPVLLVEDSLEAAKQICCYIRAKANPMVFAITGSVGKTTAKEMLYFLLKEKYRVFKNHKTENNIFGVIKTFFALRDEDILVMELGTNAPGEIAELAQIVRPDIGIITFIKPVHLEKLKSLSGIYKEKTALLKVDQQVKAVLNADDPYLRKVKFCKKIVWYGINGKRGIWAKPVDASRAGSHFLVQGKYTLTLHTPFRNFIYNVLAVIAAASFKKLSIEYCVKRLNKFKEFPASRMETQNLNNIMVINDAYNANPYAVEQALAAIKDYPQKKIVVLGDMFELGKKTLAYHEGLAHDVIKNKFEYCCLIGENMRALYKKLKEKKYTNVFHFTDHAKIAGFIKKITAKSRVKDEYLVFLKGSRRMKLEKVIEYLKD